MLPALFFFRLEYLLLSACVTNGGGIPQLRKDRCVIDSLSYLLILCLNVRWTKFSILVAV